MLIIKLFGDKHDEKFTWAIEAVDSRGTHLSTDGVDDSEKDAKACMIAALGGLIAKLEFSPSTHRRDADRRREPVD